MRHGFPSFELAQPLAKGSQKLYALGDDFQAGILRQALNRIQDKLLVTHGDNLPQAAAEGNGTVRRS
jgi:hypothetical protein